jgi:hypothetical protein
MAQVVKLVTALVHSFAAGEILPSPYDHVRKLWVELNYPAEPTQHLTSD